jgi:hypothetical protein
MHRTVAHRDNNNASSGAANFTKGKNTMKSLITFFAVALIGMTTLPAQAEFFQTIALSPTSSIFFIDCSNNTIRTDFSDPDTYTLDLTGFSTSVQLSLLVIDDFPPFPDDYDLLLDGSFIGNTGGPGLEPTFEIQLTNDVHALQINYVNLHTGINPDVGGSFYQLTINTAPEPVPAAVWLFGCATGLLGWKALKAT